MIFLKPLLAPFAVFVCFVAYAVTFCWPHSLGILLWGGMHNPLPTDVLYGRGKKFINHEGNHNLRALVKQFSPEYDQLDNKGKRGIQLQLYDKVTSSGKFITLKNNNWIEVEKKRAIRKIAQHFRSIRLELRPQRPSATPTITGGIDTNVLSVLRSFTTITEVHNYINRINVLRSFTTITEVHDYINSIENNTRSPKCHHSIEDNI